MNEWKSIYARMNKSERDSMLSLLMTPERRRQFSAMPSIILAVPILTFFMIAFLSADPRRTASVFHALMVVSILTAFGFTYLSLIKRSLPQGITVTFLVVYAACFALFMPVATQKDVPNLMAFLVMVSIAAVFALNSATFAYIVVTFLKQPKLSAHWVRV